MENSSKALYIATSVLVAVLILSLVVMMFRKMSDSQKAREKMYDEKNIAAFNAEYEAFNKRLMYGADVISCINKAISNNKEADDANDPDLYIDVVVELDQKIEEEFKICKVVKGKTQIIDTNSDKDIENVKKGLEDIDSWSVQKVFNNKSNILTEQNTTSIGALGFKTLKTNWVDTKNFHVLDKNKEYTLLKNGKIPNDTIADNPLGFLVNTKEEYIYNFTKDGNTYCIKWTTAFKAFRKSNFSCTRVEYNTDTGRINKMIFQGKTKK